MKAIVMGLALGLGLVAMAGPGRSCETDPCIETPAPATVVVVVRGECDTDPCFAGSAPAAAAVASARGDCEGNDCRGRVARPQVCDTGDRRAARAAGDCEGSDCRGARVHPWREGLRHLRHGD